MKIIRRVCREKLSGIIFDNGRRLPSPDPCSTPALIATVHLYSTSGDGDDAIVCNAIIERRKQSHRQMTTSIYPARVVTGSHVVGNELNAVESLVYVRWIAL